LRTLAAQPNANVEILIQDNASDEPTIRIIKACPDPRIVHHRSEVRLSMRNNFEDGIAAASGQYITMIGDDDAFCAGALDKMVALLEEHRPLALRWHLAAFWWNSLSDANLGFFHLHYENFFGGWRWGDARDLMQRMLDGEMAGLWQSLQLYHGAVSRELCEEARGRTDGTLLQYHIPDVYLHTALLLAAGQRANASDRRYIDMRHPMTIYGMSGHSNGSSWFAARNEERGNKAPMAAWEAAAASDTKVKLTIQNPIRCVKYHDYAALMLADSLGLVNDLSIAHDRWDQEILNEVDANLWQIRGFHEAEPTLPYERRIFKKVKQRFGSLERYAGAQPPPRLKHVYDECWRWQQLCNVSAAPDRVDDVETAVTVLDSISNSELGWRKDSLISEEERTAGLADLKTKIRVYHDANPPLVLANPPFLPRQPGRLEAFARRAFGWVKRRLLPARQSS
jgi:glycosyltransferase involved in cell wall biosynthesis